MSTSVENEVQESSWRPSYNTEMSLRQLGYDQEHLKQARQVYQQSTTKPNDKGFRDFISLGSHSEYLEMPLSWSPSGNTTRKLESMGYEEALIKHASHLFILASRETRKLIVDRESAFEAYIKIKFPLERGDKPLSKADWMTLILKGIPAEKISSCLRVLGVAAEGEALGYSSSQLRAVIEKVIN